MSKARDLANAADVLDDVSATELGHLNGVTSAIQTQLDAKTTKSTLTTTGDIYYASAANTPARLGIGTASQILAVNSGATAPEWVAAPSSGGMTVIASGSLSGASVVLSSIAQTYNNLQLVIRGFRPSSSNQELQIRFNNDSGAKYRNLVFSQGTSNPYTFPSDSIITQGQNNSTSNSFIIVDFFDYTNTTTWKFAKTSSFTNDQTTSTSANWLNVNTLFSGTAAVTSIGLIPVSGNFAAGTYILYGVK
jgi:hypothetical protein